MQYQSVLYYRDRLSPDQRSLYDQLVQQWARMEPTIRLRGDAHALSRQLNDLVHYALLDYPPLFYINYYQVRYFETPFGLRLTGSYLYSKEEARALLLQLEHWGRALVGQMDPAWTSEKKARWLHRYLAHTVKYKDTGVAAHSVIGVMHDRHAVCEGTAKAYKYACDLAGVPCIVVSGELHGGPHAWNKIWLPGRAGFVDVTNARPGRFLLPQADLQAYAWDRQLVPGIS